MLDLVEQENSFINLEHLGYINFASVINPDYKEVLLNPLVYIKPLPLNGTSFFAGERIPYLKPTENVELKMRFICEIAKRDGIDLSQKKVATVLGAYWPLFWWQFQVKKCISFDINIRQIEYFLRSYIIQKSQRQSWISNDFISKFYDHAYQIWYKDITEINCPINISLIGDCDILDLSNTLDFIDPIEFVNIVISYLAIMKEGSRVIFCVHDPENKGLIASFQEIILKFNPTGQFLYEELDGEYDSNFKINSFSSLKKLISY